MTVTDGAASLCCLRALSMLPVWMPPLPIPAYSVHRSRCTYFRGHFRSRPHVGIIRCSIAADSPLAGVVPDQRLFGSRHDRASMLADAPVLDIALESEPAHSHG